MEEEQGLDLFKSYKGRNMKKELMKVSIFDLNDIFQSHSYVMSPIKPANKFVILKNSDEIILITGNIDKFAYHAQLIEWYCEKNNLAYSWSHKPDFLEMFENKYSIKGGGYVKFNRDKDKYEFFGFSTAYGRFDDKSLNFIIKQSPTLNLTKISVVI